MNFKLMFSISCIAQNLMPSIILLSIFSQMSICASDLEPLSESSDSSDILKVLTLDHPPFVTIDHSRAEPVQGFLVDILNYLSRELKFKYTFVFNGDKKFGSLSPHNGLWNGLIWDTMNYKADMVLAGLTVNSERKNAIDFSIPYMRSKLGLYFRRPANGEPIPFSNLEELLESEHYSFGPIKDGSTISYLKSSSKHFPLHAKLTNSSRLILPNGHDEGITWAYYSNFVFISEEQYLEYYLNSKLCELMGLTMSPVTAEFAFGFPKGMPKTHKWLPKINKIIQKLVDNEATFNTNTLSNLRDLWWNTNIPSEQLCPRVEVCCNTNCI